MLAIVIPYFKITFFEATLQSLANQTDKRFKVYIGNDASLEDPTVLIEKFKGQFDIKYKKFENNLGGIYLTKQWERCIKMIGEEQWIMILGDDDVLGEKVVESWYNNYHQFNRKANIVRFASKIILENEQKTTDSFTHQIWESAKDSFYRRYKGQTRSSLSEYIFLKDSYLKFKFHNSPLAWHSDDIAWLDFSENKPIYTINESLILVRISNLSITGKFNNKDLKDLAKIQFLKNIISKKLYLFNNNQRFELLLDFEVAVKKVRKLSFQEWLLLFKLYLNIFKVIPFLKVSRRFLISILNL